MVDHLKPMLENYHISGYMCGHDHCEEYIDEGKGPKYVLTGAGFECCYGAPNVDKNPKGSIKMAYWDGDCPEGAHCPPKSPNSAFTVFEASATNMTVTFVDSAGVVLYEAPPIMPRSAAQKAMFK
jgi:acid phosphatase/tartrate-resistant acid phosphatase type 5